VRLDLAETEPEPRVEVQWRPASGGDWHNADVEPLPHREPVEVRTRLTSEEPYAWSSVWPAP
jgi:hypothetical protein